MKVKVNLVNQTLEYLDTQPYIQGTDSRNVLVVYTANVLDSIQICYQLQNGRNTIKMGNSGVVPLDSPYYLEDYTGYYFNAPSTLTSLAGNFMATLIVGADNQIFKINVLNTVLDAVNFEAYESALEQAESEFENRINAIETNWNTKADKNNANQEVTAKKFIAAKEVKVNDSGTTATLFGDELAFNSSFEIKNNNTDSSIAVDDSIEIKAEDITDFAKLKINPDGAYLELYTTDNPSTPLFKVNDSGAYYNGVKLTDKDYVDNKVADDVASEATLRQQADAYLQEQIDGINAGQNLADIVANLTALANLPTTNLKVGDKVQVLVDSNHNNASTVYNWTGTTFEYIGKYGQDSYSKDQTYTKNEVNSLLNGKADKSNTYTKAEVDEIIHDLTIEGYAIEWETLCDIFNEVYADDPLMAMLDSINGV